MRKVEKWLWRTRWAGKMSAGRVHYTEDEIRAQHPEAERVPDTMIVVEVPETDEEREAAQSCMKRVPRDFRP